MIQQQAKTIKKVVWAVDIFDDAAGARKNIAQTLKQLSRKSPVTVEPVYVLSPEQLDIPVEFSQTVAKKYSNAAKTALNQALKGYEIRGLEGPKVLIQRKSSVTGDVKSLVAHAEATRADMIVLGTHGRKGLSRFFLGSFAESLLLHTHIPVLVIGPGTQRVDSFNKILFATDFSKASEKAFERVLALAQKLGSKVTLLHNMANPVEPVFQSGVYLLGGAWVPLPVDLMKKQRARAEKSGQLWASKGKSNGVEVRFLLGADERGAVSSILGQCQRGKYDLIAMAAQSGAVSSVLIGSITRQIVREASCPVWVLRS